MIRGLMASCLVLMLGVSAFAVKEKTHPGSMLIEDQGVFDETARKKAEELFRETSFKAPTEFTVLVYTRIPDSKLAIYTRVSKDKAERSKFFGDWAREVYKDHNLKGILLFISTQGGFVRALDDRESDLSRNFTNSDLHELETIIGKAFTESKDLEEPAKLQIRGEALVQATQYVIDQLKDTNVPHGKNRVTSNQAENAGGGRSIMGWVCIGLCVAVVVWVIIGLFRAMSGAGGGYGGGGGMGGGGFFPSLMGGMFGAMAGMYLYDQFSGHNSMGDSTSSDGGYDDGGYDDTGAGDVDGGGDGGGYDGGDDWGGGGDDFGGGDFGGGDW